MDALGGECLLCGEWDHDLLDFEHIREGSGEKTASAISRVLRGDLENLQVMCVACHRKKSLKGQEVASRFGRYRRQFVQQCKAQAHSEKGE